MRKIILSGLLVISGHLFAQTNTFPADGKVGIGTASPVSKLSIADFFVEGGNINRLSKDILVSQNTYNNQVLASHTIDHNLWVSYATVYHINTLNTSGVLTNRLTIDQNGNLGVGTTAPTEKLTVNGTIRSKEIKVDNQNWPDYVFTKSYELPSLQSIEKHINGKGHLPNIPTAKEVEEKGLGLSEMNAKLLQKVEELTLYVIQLNKEIEKLKQDKK